MNDKKLLFRSGLAKKIQVVYGYVIIYAYGAFRFPMPIFISK